MTCRCEFPEGERFVWCERHQVAKNRHWHNLCMTDDRYFRAWEEGRGPGQLLPRTIPKREVDDEPRTPGVGNHLENILGELRIEMRYGCGCRNLKTSMNALGPDGCRRERDDLVAKLKVNAERYTWGDVGAAVANAAKNAVVAAVHLERVWIPNPLDPYGSLLDEAIRRTEQAARQEPA